MKNLPKSFQESYSELLVTHFSKPSRKVLRRIGNACYSYNPVLSKDQMENCNSLSLQQEQLDSYAQKNNLILKGRYGGTFETTKTDERKKFQRMINDIKKDPSISVILVYSNDRFSRSGANGFFLLDNLRSLEIRIIALTQEVDSFKSTGNFQENLYMLLSKLDNDMRKDKSISGTKSILQKGYWPYHPPIGYANKNKNSRADRHEYVINDEGVLIRQAFKWKAEGQYSNVEIVERLRSNGCKMTVENFIWVMSNPFYCGYICSRLLPGELIPTCLAAVRTF